MNTSFASTVMNKFSISVSYSAELLLQMLPGVGLCAVVGMASIELGKLGWLQAHGMSALTIAIMLGIILGNTLYPRLSSQFPDLAKGVGFSKQNLLRLGIILYGLRLTFQDINQVGIAGVMIDALVLGTTFMLAMFIGVKWLKMERETVILIGAGSSICGAAAVMATEPVVKAKPEQVTVAVSTVVVFGTLAIFVYPVLYQLNLQWLGSTSTQFGIYAGSTIHEVAQVVAAARSINQETANMAVIAKMVRVMMLAPFLMLLSAYLTRSRNGANNRAQEGRADASSATPVSARLTVPWFAFIFVAVVALNSIMSIQHVLASGLLDLDTIMLAMAMTALGLTTQVAAVQRAGFKPLILATLLFIWLIGGGAIINLAVTSFFN